MKTNIASPTKSYGGFVVILSTVAGTRTILGITTKLLSDDGGFLLTALMRDLSVARRETVSKKQTSMTKTDNDIEKKDDVEETTEESETTDTETNDEEEETESGDAQEETTDEDSNDDEFDYDGELAALKEHKKHNFDHAKARVESKNKKGTNTDVLKEIIRTELNKLKSDLTKDNAVDAVEDALAGIANPKKRELVKFHLENSIVRSGTSRQAVAEDVQKALAITDMALSKKRKTEKNQSMIAKETVSKGTSDGAQPPGKSKESWEKVLTPSDIAFGKKRGWTKEMFQKAANLKLKRTN